MAKNGKGTKNTRQTAIRVHFVSNGDNCKTPKVIWCEGGMKI